MTSVESRSPRVLGCVLVAVLAALVLGAAPAFGALTFPFERQLAPSSGSFGQLEMGSVAVDDANGNTYVADSGLGAVDVFNAVGTELASLSGEPDGSFGHGEVSVAVAANDGTGEVYVLDATHDVVDVFESSGGYLCQITSSATPSATECDKAGSKTPAGGFSGPGGITVDQATGDVYVVDENHGVVDVFSAGGEYLRQIELGSIPGAYCVSCARGVAVDDFNGDVYVASYGEVYEFDAAGVFVTAWTGANTTAGSFPRNEELGVAADNTNGDVFVSVPNFSEHQRNAVDVFEPSGGYMTQLSHAFNSRPFGVAVDQASGRVYVAESESPAMVDVFGAAQVIPDVTTQAAGEVHPTSATLQGTVNPDGFKVSDCHFDYGTEETYGQSAQCVPAPGSGGSPVAVHADIAGLQPGTTYHFRLQASNENCATCTNYGGDETFATPPPPSIENANATDITSGAADLNADVDPNGYQASYRFEWGTSTAYGSTLPAPDGQLEANAGSVPVSVRLTGLTANTTYHWRVVVSNENGTMTGVDHTFIYSTGGEGLPDGREYEMVTPQRKNGAFISPAIFGVAEPSISEDGKHVVVYSIQCFAGAESCTAVRQTQGEPYLITRSAEGWATSALAPPAPRFRMDTALGVSPESGVALFSMPTPPAGGDGFYARLVDGTFAYIGQIDGPGSAGDAAGAFLGTTDLSHLVWFNRDSFLPTEDKTVYEYAGSNHSEPTLVGVKGGPGSTELVSQCYTFLPYDNFVSQGSLSADGGTVFFTADGHRPSEDGGACPPAVAAPVANQVWARIDGARSVLLSAQSPVDCRSAACLGSPAGGAEFVGASLDGSKAFFLSTQRLMDSASEDPNSSDHPTQNGCTQTVGENGCNLYEYDFANPAGENLVDVSAGDTSGGGPRVQDVVAISNDGSHVYFVAQGVLGSGQNARGQAPRSGTDNLYVFERDAEYPDGHVAFIAMLPESDRVLWTSPTGYQEGAAPFTANVTPDGRFLVFTSHGTLTADDASTEGAVQVFRYDALTGSLIRISIGDRGFNDNGNVVCSENCPSAGIAAPEHTGVGPAYLDPTMSSDGSYVFFTSPVGLTPRALNDVPLAKSEVSNSARYAENVYEWHEGRVFLVSDGRDTSAYGSVSNVTLIGTDATGADVFFTTADQLVPQDTDTEVDIYDARICTASEPCPPPPAEAIACEGEGCHGVPGGAPSAANAGTIGFQGSGNLTPTSVKAPQKKAAVKKKKHVSRRHARKRRSTGVHGAKRHSIHTGRGGRS
jgi:hypothetical protein